MGNTTNFYIFASVLLGCAVGLMTHGFYRIYVMTRVHKQLLELEHEYKYLVADLYMKHHSGIIEEEEFLGKEQWLGQLYTGIAMDLHRTKGKTRGKEKVSR